MRSGSVTLPLSAARSSTSCESAISFSLDRDKNCVDEFGNDAFSRYKNVTAEVESIDFTFTGKQEREE